MQMQGLCHDVPMSSKKRRKTGPPPGTGSKGERLPVTVRIPKDLKPRLEKVAAARGTSVSEITSDLLEVWVPQAEREDGLPQQGQFDLEDTG